MIRTGESFVESYGEFVAWLLAHKGVDGVKANIIALDGGVPVFAKEKEREKWMARLAEKYNEYRNS